MDDALALRESLRVRIHYSSVGIDEQRIAVAAVAELVRAGGDRGGDRQTNGTGSG